MRCNCACTQNKSSRKIRSSTLPKGRERKVMMRPYYGFCFVVAGVSQMSGKCPWSICSHSVKSDRFHANSIMFHQMHFHTILLKKNISPPPHKKRKQSKNKHVHAMFPSIFPPFSPAFSICCFPQHFPYATEEDHERKGHLVSGLTPPVVWGVWGLQMNGNMVETTACIWCVMYICVSIYIYIYVPRKVNDNSVI